jgi:hypothetical protein
LVESAKVREAPVVEDHAQAAGAVREHQVAVTVAVEIDPGGRPGPGHTERLVADWSDEGRRRRGAHHERCDGNAEHAGDPTPREATHGRP